MNPDHTPENVSKKLKGHARLSALITGAGLVLLAYMITVEGEPGALPLLLVAGGIGWYLITRARLRALRT